MNVGGTITLSSTGNLTAGIVNASGINQAAGGTLSVTSTTSSVNLSGINVSGYYNVAGTGNLSSNSYAGTATITANSGTITLGSINRIFCWCRYHRFGCQRRIGNIIALSSVSVTGSSNLNGLNGANAGSLTITSTAGGVSFGGAVNLSADATSSNGFGGLLTVTAGNGTINASSISVNGVGTNYAGGIVN